MLKIQNTITTYVSGYSSMQFYNVYSFKEGVNAQIQRKSLCKCTERSVQIKRRMLRCHRIHFLLSGRRWMVSWLCIPMDTRMYTADTFTADMYNPASYAKTNLKGNAQDHIGQAIVQDRNQ
ncbi:MAG: hypothetical protein ACLUD0_12680 [Eubacterium ramulus]